jgi:hypothetical protein
MNPYHAYIEELVTSIKAAVTLPPTVFRPAGPEATFLPAPGR